MLGSIPLNRARPDAGTDRVWEHAHLAWMYPIRRLEVAIVGQSCQPIKYVLFGFAKRTGSFGPMGRSTRVKEAIR